MKKYLFITISAALALTACTNETTEYVGDTQAREIAFAPLAQKATRAAVNGTTFPTDMTMTVAAYDVTNSRDYFDATTFSYNTSSWKGNKYWPLSPTTINFLAYAELNGTSATWGTTNKASGVTLTMTDNSTSQKDLMYARGTGSVTQSGNTLNFPGNVSMEFKHAQALIYFTVQAASGSEDLIQLKSITVNNAGYQGTYTINHVNYSQATGQEVYGVWTDYDVAHTPVNVPAETTLTPHISNFPHTVTTTQTNVGGLMVVPNRSFDNFTITYTLDSKDYTYIYTPDSRTLEQGKKYTYNITFTLHEILINPTVTDWTSGGGSINIG